jgi:hypothetical protein
MRDKTAMPTARRHCFLWDVLVSPSKLKQNNKKFCMTIKSKPAKFSGIQENLSSENFLTKVIFTFIQLFSFRNVCCDRNLCITKAAAIVIWHNNCSLLPAVRASRCFAS